MKEESMFWRTDVVWSGGKGGMLGNEAEEAAGTLATNDRYVVFTGLELTW